MTVNSVEEAKEFAISNDIILLTREPVVLGEFIYFPVDSDSDLSSFYLWSEIRPTEQPMKEVWRSFLWVVRKDHEEDIWGTNKFLKDIMITENVSAYTLLEEYFKCCWPKSK